MVSNVVLVYSLFLTKHIYGLVIKVDPPYLEHSLTVYSGLGKGMLMQMDLQRSMYTCPEMPFLIFAAYDQRLYPGV